MGSVLRLTWALTSVVAAKALARVVPRTLITFDVDSTLVKGSSQQAEASAHARAFAAATGVVFGDGTATALPADVLPGEAYHGSTDGLIAMRLARATLGVSAAASGARLDEVFRAMYDFVRPLSDAAFAEGLEPLPGVLETLARVARDGEVVAGVVSGNVEAIARKKLRATRVFATGALAPPAPEQVAGGALLATAEADAAFLGGFGTDYCSKDVDDATRNHLDRAAQIAVAWRRAKAAYPTLDRLVHVGDAPSDVLAAKTCAWNRDLFEAASAAPNVVACVGVATGTFDAATLAALAGDPVPGTWEPVVLQDGVGDPSFLQRAKGR